MSFAEVRDYAMWIDQLYGNPELKSRITAMADGEEIQLEIDGVRGTWSRVTGTRDGAPRAGVKPSGDAMRHWLALRDEKYAGIASVRDCSASAD